jgi:hypothetical protein
MGDLIARIDTQWSIVVWLMTKHDSDTNIAIAQDTRADSVIMKRDSLLMRRIAAVSIIFLPATFMATFFSMMFFHNDQGELKLNGTIWVYIVCTTALSTLIVLHFRFANRWHAAVREMLRRFRKSGKEKSSKDEESRYMV